MQNDVDLHRSLQSPPTSIYRQLAIIIDEFDGQFLHALRRIYLSKNPFRDFIARAGYRILQVPETPHEFVGQYLPIWINLEQN
jgi:hypothetical protein